MLRIMKIIACFFDKVIILFNLECVCRVGMMLHTWYEYKRALTKALRGMRC